MSKSGVIDATRFIERDAKTTGGEYLHQLCAEVASHGDLNNDSSEEYETKFAEFLEMCRTSVANDQVIVADPCALGDTYTELIKSLNRLSDSELVLRIVPTNQRGAADE